MSRVVVLAVTAAAVLAKSHRPPSGNACPCGAPLPRFKPVGRKRRIKPTRCFSCRARIASHYPGGKIPRRKC